MVHIEKDDLPAEEQDLFEFLSDDSDKEEGDDEEQAEEKLREKLSQIEPLLQMDYTFPSTIALVGVPKVGKDKHEKLRIVLGKKMIEELSKKGAESVNEGLTISMPVNEETGMTKGFCFVTFSSQFNAQHAAHHLNGWALDAKHTFRAALLDDFDEIVGRGADYRPPIKLLGFTRENFRWWLLDPRGREQFVTRYADETEIYWHDPIERDCCSLVYNGHRERADGKRVWTDFRVQWSPQGSFLATFHRPGIALWAGDNFEKKVRFEHKDVKQIEFSPNETYVITWDGSPSQLRNEKAVRIWKVMTGELLRQFPTPANSPRGGEYPHFFFSHDDRYVARMGEKELCVYQMECEEEQEAQDGEKEEKTRKGQDRCSVRLLKDPKDGKLSSLKYPLEKFEWSPTENIISVWIKGSEDAPGRLLLVDIPSRRELSSKNVYNVKGASMHWQTKGDFLCLRTVVFKKTGLQCTHGTTVGVTCAVVPLEPGSWLPPLLPQTLSLYPTNLPPSALQEKCMEEVGSGAASKWPGAVLGLRTKDHRFHCQERYTGDQAKPAGAQPCGLNACNLTAISVLRGSILDQKGS